MLIGSRYFTDSSENEYWKQKDNRLLKASQSAIMLDGPEQSRGKEAWRGESWQWRSMRSRKRRKKEEPMGICILQAQGYILAPVT